MIDLYGVSIPAIHIHLITLALSAVCILIADHEAFSWMRGKKEMLSKKMVQSLHIVIGIGLTLMIVSGALLFFPAKEYFLQDAMFWVKMTFVLILVVNSFFIGKCMHIATERSFVSLTAKEKLPLFFFGAVSAIGWLGAFIAALLMSTSNWILSFASEFLTLFR